MKNKKTKVMDKIKITMVQSNLYWENREANLSMFTQKLQKSKGETDLIVLPEMFTTGFTMQAKKCAETMNGKAVQWMHAQALQYKCCLAGSLIIEEYGQYYNRLFFFRPDGSFRYYDKKHLFIQSGEDKQYTAGTKKIIETVKGWNILPLICFDLRYPVWSRNSWETEEGQEVKTDYDVLLYSASWPEERSFAWTTLLTARALENQAYVVGVNRIGVDPRGAVYSGDSMAVNPLGKKISRTLPFEEATETIELDDEELAQLRNNFPMSNDLPSKRQLSFV